ncbi:hypothetical protein CDAR_399321 [Caerostris darwini]|uniref:Uncharacterized protein n=1 Tax=Caerostris darwini TaxID=1538125 RepID=A0AAV4SZY6_9ARAC|nr:hypothetical protein CDAR_399321 [Caerostris darwini]
MHYFDTKKSKPAERPTTFEGREKRLQKEYSCVENLNQKRISPSDTSFLVKRRSITPAKEASSAAVARMLRFFKCPFCSYGSKWKSDLNRHQLQQPQNQQHYPTAVPNQPRSPGSNTTTTTASTSESESKGFSMVLNQPLYAAVSTCASIPVPCPYGAGGGLSPAAVSIPAGNMISPNPSTTPESNSDSQGGNVTPTYTAMPGSGVFELNCFPCPVFGDDVVKEVAKPMKTYEEKVANHIPSKSPKEQSKDETEKPLDLSFKKRDVEFEKSIAPKSSTNTDNY